MLYVACRRHIYDLGNKASFHELFGMSTGPYFTLYKLFLDVWDDLDKNPANLRRIHFRSPFLRQEALNLQAVCNKFLARPTTREDYKQTAQLYLRVFGFEIPQSSSDASLRRPGPVNDSRWMQHLIYAILIFGLSSQLELDPQFEANLKRYIRFHVIFGQFWLTATHAQDSSANDLSYLQKVNSAIRWTISDINIATNLW
jgi:hypothetical protein